jgi:hypothetical protein
MNLLDTFLLRSAVRSYLVDAGEMDRDEAFADMIPAFEEIMAYDECPTCGAAPCANPSFCESCRRAEASRKREPVSQRTILHRRLLDKDISIDRAWRELQPKVRIAVVREVAA